MKQSTLFVEYITLFLMIIIEFLLGKLCFVRTDATENVGNNVGVYNVYLRPNICLSELCNVRCRQVACARIGYSASRFHVNALRVFEWADMYTFYRSYYTGIRCAFGGSR